MDLEWGASEAEHEECRANRDSREKKGGGELSVLLSSDLRKGNNLIG